MTSQNNKEITQNEDNEEIRMKNDIVKIILSWIFDGLKEYQKGNVIERIFLFQHRQIKNSARFIVSTSYF